MVTELSPEVKSSLDYSNKTLSQREGEGRGEEGRRDREVSQLLACFSGGAIWLIRGRNGGRDIGGRGRKGNECRSPRLCAFK